MITLNQIEKRKYDIMNNDKYICKLDLIFSPATNKFKKISEYIEDCSEKIGSEFDNWFEKYLTDYINSNYDYTIIKDNIPQIKMFVEKHLKICNINFNNYINKDKISKNSIFFDAEEIYKLILAANYLKLYFILSQDSIMKLPIKFHREIFSILIKDISDYNILFKLYKIVSAKTYKYNMTDNYMWEYIKNLYCKTTDMHIMSIFNFILNNILVTCDTKENPIPYITSVIDESINWLLRSVYKDVIIYSDTIATEDINPIIGRDNLKTYSYNDTIGKLILISYNCLEQNTIKETNLSEFIRFDQEISLFAQYVTYPILSKVLEIPYRHFLTIPVEHSYLLNIFLYTNLPNEFKKKYPSICEYLLHYNKDKSIQKTTYRIKNINHFLNSSGSFLGFKNIFFVHDFYSSIIGKLSRNTYVNLRTGKEVTNFPLARLENDLVLFYNDFFDNRLKNTFKDLRDKIDKVMI